MNKSVDNYFIEGCGRCQFGGTPQCKVHKWPNELEHLRRIALACGLQEESKWGVPCYTYKNSNILIVAAFKDFAAISFFKGALLQDAAHILKSPGENSQSGRIVPFTGIAEILNLEAVLKSYIFEAIEVEKAGLKIAFKKIEEYSIPEEFQKILETNPSLRVAFDALTSGRKKGYLLHFAAAKQTKTKIDRIEKCIPKIKAGIGLHD